MAAPSTMAPPMQARMISARTQLFSRKNNAAPLEQPVTLRWKPSPRPVPTLMPSEGHHPVPQMIVRDSAGPCLFAIRARRLL